jgi:hypothetical protein
MQRCETTSIANGHCVAFARRADGNSFTHARRNADDNSVPNADGTHADTVTPVTEKP